MLIKFVCVIALGCQLPSSGNHVLFKAPWLSRCVVHSLRAREASLRLRGGNPLAGHDVLEEEEDVEDPAEAEEELTSGEYFENLEEGYLLDCEENLDKPVRVGWAPMDDVNVRVIPAEEGCLLGSDGKGWHGPLADWFPSTQGTLFTIILLLMIQSTESSPLKAFTFGASFIAI